MDIAPGHSEAKQGGAVEGVSRIRRPSARPPYAHIHPLHRRTSTGRAHTPSARKKNARHRPHRYPSVSVDSTARRSLRTDDTPAQPTDIRLVHLPSLSQVRLACASAHVHIRRRQAERHPHGSITAHRMHTSCSRRPTHAHSRVCLVRRTHRIRTSARTGMYPIHTRPDGVRERSDASAPMSRGAARHPRETSASPSRAHAPPHTSSSPSLHAHQSCYLLRPTRRVEPSVNIFSS
jgi:hypothetical protein